MTEANASETLGTLLSAERFGILCTSADGWPYGNLVAFAVAGKMESLLFATHMSSRKYRNLSLNPRASMVIDNRTNSVIDLDRAAAATATGPVFEVPPVEKSFRDLYLSRHPYLCGLFESPSFRLFRIAVEKYHLVMRFQNVTEIEVTHDLDI
ncbi:MAG: pyridoxamine 5'-phosphate oxidase family protein [Thermovirgaceae bacterium]